MGGLVLPVSTSNAIVLVLLFVAVVLWMPLALISACDAASSIALHGEHRNDRKIASTIPESTTVVACDVPDSHLIDDERCRCSCSLLGEKLRHSIRPSPSCVAHGSLDSHGGDLAPHYSGSNPLSARYKAWADFRVFRALELFENAYGEEAKTASSQVPCAPSRGGSMLVRRTYRSTNLPQSCVVCCTWPRTAWACRMPPLRAQPFC